MPHETIHSGHFMTSNPHTETPIDDEDEDVEVDVVEDEEKPGLKRKESVATEDKPVTFYKFGATGRQSFAIDTSLNKLNKCIKVAYNKMTTPKWKDFKGLRLHWKQRIRLNNVIWRAYHMEFGRPLLLPKKKKSPYCFFAVPDDDATHVKIEGTVLEGMYWKRRVEAVCAQYKKWRHFNRPRHPGGHHETLGHKKSSSSLLSSLPLSSSLYLDSFGEKRKKKESLPIRSQTPKNTSTEYFDIDDLENEFTDTLFESLNQPYMFPNPREFGSSNADFMQPGLLSLQPSLEEIMASLINDEDDTLPFLDLATPGTSQSIFNVTRSPQRLQQPQQQSRPAHAPQPPSAAAAATSNRGAAAAPVQQQQAPITVRRAPLPPAKRIAAVYDQQLQLQQQQQQQQQQQAAAAAAAQQQRIYSSKDYLAASMLVDYSNQSPSRSSIGSASAAAATAAASAVLQQPTRQSSIGSPMMLSQPQYTSATQYGSGGGVIGAPLSVPEWKPVGAGGAGLLSGATGVHLASATSHLLGAAAAGANNSFLVTGGDVIATNMDYMPQFLSAAAAAASTTGCSPAPSTSTLMMQAAANYTRGLNGIPGISTASGTSIGSPGGGSAFTSHTSRFWMDSIQPSTSGTPVAASPVAASPLAAAAASAASPAATAAAAAGSAAALLTRSHSHLGHGGVQQQQLQQLQHMASPASHHHHHFVDPHGLVPSPGSLRLQHSQQQRPAAAAACSLPRDTLSERLGTRSVLVDGTAPSTSRRGVGGAAAGLTQLSAVASSIGAGASLAPPHSAPAETTENPWDRDDPGTSGVRLFMKEEEEMMMQEESMMEGVVKEEDELDLLGGSGPSSAAAAAAARPVRPGGKRGTKQVPADSTLHPTERKRILHLHAEQSRRMALKDGFDQLMEIVPDVHSGGIKPTNAVVLAKAADHIKALSAKKTDKEKKIAEMQETIRMLNERISTLQSSLPSSRKDEASSSLDQKTAIEQFYERYTKERTKEDWRFWLMARLFKPMVSNYAAAVHDDPAEKEEVAQSAALWMAEQWRVSKLRPLSSEVLVYLATNTRFLHDPASLKTHIEEQINNGPK